MFEILILLIFIGCMITVIVLTDEIARTYLNEFRYNLFVTCGVIAVCGVFFFGVFYGIQKYTGITADLDKTETHVIEWQPNDAKWQIKENGQ